MLIKAFGAEFKEAGDGAPEGRFEAIVSVFGNVDRVGDKVMPGAFADSLKAWEESGDPIPIVFAHKWDDLDAHIGKVLKAEERDEGLWIDGQLNMGEDFARRVWGKMKERTLTQFSFAYDEVDEKWVEGVHELRKLDLLEVGPCLVGANRETRLLGVKELGRKPYPNEHACRLRPPADFDSDSFRRVDRDHEGKRYSVIMGRLSGEDTMTEQAYRYPIDEWGEEAARNHCGDHDGSFEAAEPEKSAKIGARHTSKEYQMIQSIHDKAVELGAKCAHEEDEGGDGDGKDDGGDGKAVTPSVRPSTIAARIALELMAAGVAEEG